MQSWQAGIDRTQGPLHLAIADAIGRAVAAGELRPGERLPPQRTLATELGVDLIIVSRAYAEARRRGLLQTGIGRGTFARAVHHTAATAPAPSVPAPSAPAETPRAAPPPEPAVVDPSMNLPPQPTAPDLRELLRAGMEGLLRRSAARDLMTCRLGAGSQAERAAGAAWLRPLLGEVDPARVLVCPGAQGALVALLTTLLRPGDTMATDRLTYPGLRALAAQFGIRLVGVAGDAEGMLPDALDKACRTARAKALYALPTIQNPTTITMPASRRVALAEVAARHRLAVIEDDPYGLLPAEPPAPIAALAGGTCITSPPCPSCSRRGCASPIW